MSDWTDFEQSINQKHWSKWSMRRPKKTLALNNYLSAGVFSLSAYVVFAAQAV